MAATKKPRKAPPRTNQALYTSPVRQVVCGGCRRPVLIASVDGLRVRCDPWPLEPSDVARALLVGRRLYLRMTSVLVWLDADRIGLLQRWPVVAQHWCGGIFRASGRPREAPAALPGIDAPPY